MQEMIDLDPLAFAARPARERILLTASDLFYRHSIHAVGIDRIISESGVAKMTFYKHFPSKAQLIAEYLRHKTTVWMEMLSASTNCPGLTPIGRVLSIFDALGESFQRMPFRGCPFVKGLAEFGPDADEPEVQATITAYFEGLHDLIAGIVAPMQLKEPETAVLQVLSLIQGAIVMAQTSTAPAIAVANRETARLLLEAASNRSG